jgi:hypothetical protein
MELAGARPVSPAAEGIDVSHGLMMGEAEALNKGFLNGCGFPYSSCMGACWMVAPWPAAVEWIPRRRR